MLKISSQRLLINFTSSYVLKQDFFYPNILATHSWLLLNIRNSKLIITFKIKSYLKGIFASLMILTNNPFKSSLQYLQPTFLIRHFYAFCSLCTWSFKKIYPSQFLILCNKKWWFHSFVYHIFYHANFRWILYLKLSWKFVVLHFIEDAKQSS